MKIILNWRISWTSCPLESLSSKSSFSSSRHNFWTSRFANSLMILKVSGGRLHQPRNVLLWLDQGINEWKACSLVWLKWYRSRLHLLCLGTVCSASAEWLDTPHSIAPKILIELGVFIDSVSIGYQEHVW